MRFNANHSCLLFRSLHLQQIGVVSNAVFSTQRRRGVCALTYMLRWLGCFQDTVIEEDKEFVTQYFDMPDTDFADMERMSPWLLRIELNREMLTDKGLNMSRIADTITSEFGEEMSVIFTDDNAPKHILRVSCLHAQRGLFSSNAKVEEPIKWRC